MTFDLHHFEEVLALVQTTAKTFPEFFHQGLVVLRFLKASSALTSTSGGKDSFVLEWVTSSRIIDSNSDWAREKVDCYDNMMRQMVKNWGAITEDIKYVGILYIAIFCVKLGGQVRSKTALGKKGIVLF